MNKALKEYMNYWRYALNTTEEASRSEYWFPTLTHVVAFTILALADIDNLETDSGEQLIDTKTNKLYSTLALITLVPSYSLFSRRLNKLGVNNNIAKAAYSVNALGYLWVVGMSKASQDELNKKFGSKNFKVLAGLLGLAFITEVAVAAKKDN
ncbi:DUF805 domain-containing protein [Macrococcus animalis]|uniref:DUF805 domain-containing protein n=1 Tax=Macrococcus animalis TaxID=3395467 RepID=UPI0039BDBC77